MQDFRSTIAEIRTQVVDLTAPDDLLRQPAFRVLRASPGAIREEALALLGDPQAQRLDKLIVAHAMQPLPLDAFIAFVGAAADLVEVGRLEPRVLERLAFPMVNFGTPLVMNPEDPAVRALLVRLAAMPALRPGIRDYIRAKVLPGIARHELRDFQEGG